MKLFDNKRRVCRKINNLRPNKRKVDKDPRYCMGYVDALNDVITKVVKP